MVKDMTPQEFVTKLKTYIGQPVESEDPTALDQCMDWAFKGCDILGIDRGAIRHQYAYQVWKNPNDQTVIQFEFIPNTPTGVPQAGDLPIFDQNVAGVTGIAGHICWATGEGDANSFKSLDQNWNGVLHITEESHSYDGVLGWLRPRIFQQQIVDQIRIDRDTNYNNYQDTLKSLTVVQNKLAACMSQSNSSTQPQPQVPDSTTPPQTPPVQSQPPTTQPDQTTSQKMNILFQLWKWLIG